MEQPSRKPSRPKSRQSIAHLPTSNGTATDKENATTDVSALQKRADEVAAQPLKRKVRGKSLGPGGLEALKESNGNTSKVRAMFRFGRIAYFVISKLVLSP